MITNISENRNLHIIRGILADMESETPTLDPADPKQRETSDYLRSLCYKVLQMRGNQQIQAAEILVSTLVQYAQKHGKLLDYESSAL